MNAYDQIYYYYIDFAYLRMIAGLIISMILVSAALEFVTDGTFLEQLTESKILLVILLSVVLFLVVWEVSSAASVNRLNLFEQIRISDADGYKPNVSQLTDKTGTMTFSSYEEAMEYSISVND